MAQQTESGTDLALCAECKQLFDASTMMSHAGLHVCARCKPLVLQKIAEGAQLENAHRHTMSVWLILLLLAVIGFCCMIALRLFNPALR